MIHFRIRRGKMWMRLCCIPALGALAVSYGFCQRGERRALADPTVLSIGDVCAAVAPAVAREEQFQWSPDGKSLAYFKPASSGVGLQLTLELATLPGGERRVLLQQKQMDALLPSAGGEDKDAAAQSAAHTRESMGMAWSADGSGLLLRSDRRVFWLDVKTLETRMLVTGKETIRDVQLSPDGRSVAFARDHNLWIVPVSGGAAHALTSGGTESLKKGELDWLYPAELGTKHGYVWSPDSSHIAYMVFDLKVVARYTPPFASEEDSAQTIDYPPPGGRNPSVSIFVASVDQHSAGRPSAPHPSPPRLIETGSEKDVYLPRMQWLPDSKELAVEVLNRPQNQLHLLLADIHTGASRTLLTEKDPYWINLGDELYFFKSGAQFLWSSERSGYRHLFLYQNDGKLVRQLTDGPWEVTSLDAVDERRGTVYFTSTQAGSVERQLYSIDLEGKEKKQISTGSGTHKAFFADDASAYLDDFSTATKPWMRSVFRLDAATGSAAGAKLFALDEPAAAGVKKPTLHDPIFLTVKTHDGADLNGMMIRPVPFLPDKKYPSIVYIDGGPGSQAVRDSWSGDISEWNQLLAARGFVIFAVDNRGTAGKGHAFEESTHLRLEGQETADQQDAVRFLKALPYVDPARVGVWGRGFGAALTVRAMVHPPLMYTAGFAVAPIVNWTAYDSAFTERYLGDPVTNQDGYLSSNPLDEWQRYKGPMLVGQGLADLSVHPDQLMELQQAVVEKKRYLETALFPGQSLVIHDPNACEVLFQRATDFFASSLAEPAAKPQTAPPTTPPTAPMPTAK